LEHIRFNLGNVLIIGAGSLLFYGSLVWGSKFLAPRNIPGVSPVAKGALKLLAAEEA
jgi:hypothetical protein